jgi:hypothetical protein
MSKKKLPNLNGPESIPLRDYVKSFPMIVTVYDDDDNVIREEVIDYGNAEHRRWLGKVTHWACSNGNVVQTQKA